MNPKPYRLLAVFALVLSLLACAARAQEAAPESPPADASPPADVSPAADTSSEPPVAARVNGDPIFFTEMEASFRKIARQRRLTQERANRSRAEMLEQLINRRLALQVLKRDKSLAPAEEVDQQLDQMKKQVEDQGVTIEEFARSRGVTVEALRDDIYWQLAWQRYLDRHLANQLQQYFNSHKKDLDGTVIRASHILLRPERFNETETETEARAKKIRQEIESGQTSFVDAAKKYSVAPSADKGGDVGTFPRRGVMTEEFAKAAFALNKGEVSEPVTTTFGTHLITVTDVQPGGMQWTQVVDQIRPLASVDMFEQLVDQAKNRAKIEFTGLAPYFDPETDELVEPKPKPAAKE